ncbi:MAG: GNAT family N-acetyltransferase [Solirubrobacterales bacterium]
MDASVWNTDTLARMQASMRAAWTGAAAGSAGGRVIEREGVMAMVLPAIPERSVFNSVLYDAPGHLARALPDIAREYEDAGVDAWTVWLPDHDSASAELLASAGHKLDAHPRAMALRLDALPEPDPGDLEWTSEGSLEAMKLINEAAYGYEPGTFERGLGQTPEGTWRIYEARLEGSPASVLATTDVDGDCGIWWVATLPEARGRGLSRDLLRVALAEARERGLETSTLQATKLGRPVYERVGYSDHGGLHMWERRK